MGIKKGRSHMAPVSFRYDYSSPLVFPLVHLLWHTTHRSMHDAVALDVDVLRLGSYC
jgi:hypothetical protein